eukprot:jgi/Hompol1/5324/HPOL_004334-RA
MAELPAVKVLNLSMVVTKDLLETFFGFVGTVEGIDLKASDAHPNTQEALVRFSSAEEAALALHLTGTTIADKTLFITSPAAYSQPNEAVIASYAKLEAAAVAAAAASGELHNYQKGIERTLYAGNLHSPLTSDEIFMLFSSCGDVLQVRMAGDPLHSTRYAFIEFATPEGATMALNLQGMIVAGRSIK